MNLYIDESGTINNNKLNKSKFFVIGGLDTDDPYQVIRQFKRAKKDFINRHPECGLNIKNEIKGSEMPYGMKKMIFDRIKKNTDAKFHFILVDNHNLYQNLLEQPSLTFNYMISVGINSLNKKSLINDYNRLFMLIDERNQAVSSLNSLEEYLKIEFTIKVNMFDKIKVRYKDSGNKDLIQLADIFCNTVYRVAKNHALDSPIRDNKNRKLLESCNIGISDYFPIRMNDIDICK